MVCDTCAELEIFVKLESNTNLEGMLGCKSIVFFYPFLNVFFLFTTCSV